MPPKGKLVEVAAKVFERWLHVDMIFEVEEPGWAGFA
jgi:hypothetical protein